MQSKIKLSIAGLLVAVLLFAGATGNIRWTQIRSADRSGAAHSVAINETSTLAGVALGAHQTLIGASSADPSAKTVTDCTDTGGNHLNFTQSTDAFSCGTSGGGSGTVTSVAQTVPTGFSISGSPVTTSGTLAITYATGQTANRFLATPDGTTGALSLRAIVGGDLPTPTTSIFGGIKDIAAVAHQWVDSIVSGVPHLSQPALGDITFSGSSTQCVRGDGSIGSCTVFSGGSNFFGITAFTAPPSSSWTWDNQTTSTINSTFGYEYMHAVATGANQLTLRYRTAGATPYTVTACFLSDAAGLGSTTNDTNDGISLAFRQSTTGKIVDLRVTNNAGAQGVVTTKWTNSTTVVAAYSNITGPAFTLSRGINWLRIKDDGTNLIFSLSIDGNNWVQFDSRLRGDFMTVSGGVTGPDQIGFGAYVNGGNVELALVSWAIT